MNFHKVWPPYMASILHKLPKTNRLMFSWLQLGLVLISYIWVMNFQALFSSALSYHLLFSCNNNLSLIFLSFLHESHSVTFPKWYNTYLKVKSHQNYSQICQCFLLKKWIFQLANFLVCLRKMAVNLSIFT